MSDLHDLLKKSQAELDNLYRGHEAGPMPDGVSQGVAIFLPGTPFAGLLAGIAAPIWQGKVFNRAAGTLVNRVLGFKTIQAKIYMGESWFDSKPAIIVDYSQTSLVASQIRDEIRQIAPGVYLGRGYWRAASKPLVVNFALKFGA